MNRKLHTLINTLVNILIISIIFILPVQVSAAEANQYILGPGDKIEIKVFGQDDLTIVTLLGNSGKINYPFLGELKIVGLTVKQVEGIIKKGLKGPFLVNPNVYTSVVEYRPFYIHGEVARPGGYPYQPGLTVNQAVALAGGFTERASKDKIYLYKEDDKNTRTNASLGSQINAGDTITIDQGLF